MKTYLMYPDITATAQEPETYEVLAKDGNVFEPQGFLLNDSPEVFAAAYML